MTDEWTRRAAAGVGQPGGRAADPPGADQPVAGSPDGERRADEVHLGAGEAPEARPRDGGTGERGPDVSPGARPFQSGQPRRGPSATARRPPGSPPRGTAVITPAPGTARRPTRRARLVLKRIDPWSILRLTFVYSLALYLIILVAVSALYALLAAMGVFHSLDTFFHDVGSTSSASSYFGFGRVFLVALVIGAVNVVLLTALVTLGAFLYNLCVDLVGGVELTLTEAE